MRYLVLSTMALGTQVLDTQVFRYSGIQVFRYSVLRHSGTQIFRYSVLRYSSIKVLDTQVFSTGRLDVDSQYCCF